MTSVLTPRKGFYNLEPKTATRSIKLKTFSVLWAIATLFHLAHSGLFDVQLNYALLSIAAMFVIFRPSLRSLMVLIVLQLYEVITLMPHATNHWLFTGFVNLTILHILIDYIIRHRSLKVNEDSFFNSISRAIRWEIIILYFYAVFHKLNSGFFTSDTSCATELFKAQNIDSVISLTPALIAINPYAIIFIELLIPLLLIFNKTRHAAILIGFFFHCVLSYNSYNAFYDFSSMILAAYFLFMDDNIGGWIVKQKNRFVSVRENYLRKYSTRKVLFLFFLILVFIVLVYILNKTLTTYSNFHLYFFWTIFSILYISIFIAFLLHRRTALHNLENKKPIVALRLKHGAFALVPILVFINGISPYLGLKTEGSFSMFSNLRTEGGVSNHYIIPASFQIFDYQKEVVEIISSTDKTLEHRAKEQKLMVLFELQNYVVERKTKEVVFSFEGKQYHYKRGTQEIPLLQNDSYALSRLMKFRTFPKNGPQPCGH